MIFEKIQEHTANVNYLEIVPEPCVICGDTKESFSTIIPLESKYASQIICSTCFMLYFNGILEQILNDENCPICNCSEKKHEVVFQCPQ